jgi:hypothetical protein
LPSPARGAVVSRSIPTPAWTTITAFNCCDVDWLSHHRAGASASHRFQCLRHAVRQAKFHRFDGIFFDDLNAHLSFSLTAGISSPHFPRQHCGDQPSMRSSPTRITHQNGLQVVGNATSAARARRCGRDWGGVRSMAPRRSPRPMAARASSSRSHSGRRGSETSRGRRPTTRSCSCIPGTFRGRRHLRLGRDDANRSWPR